MSKAACKEEENSLVAERMAVLSKRQQLFESYMRQGLATEEEIEGCIQADRDLKPFLNNACESYKGVNAAISVRGSS